MSEVVEKPRRDIFAFAAFTWTSIGLINSIIDQSTETASRVHQAWPIIGPFLAIVGFGVANTTVLTLFFASLAFGFRRVTNALFSGSDDAWLLKAFIVVFSLIGLVNSISQEALMNKELAEMPPIYFLSIAIGMITVMYTLFQLYIFFRDHGYLPGE